MGRYAWLVSLLGCLLSWTAPASGQGYICAEGGGSAGGGDWAPSVFGWMVEKADGGSVVILGVREAGSALAEVFLRHGATSAANLTITEENADAPETYEAISRADIVWIRGGNQANYVRFWKDTRTEHAIRAVHDRGGVVGGTSAGCAVLGEVAFDALVGSLRPRQALRDSHHRYLTLTTDFLRLVPGVLFDTHFTERGRLGRLVVMMARHYDATGEDILAIGVDHRTALCISPDGTAEVRGEGAVTFLHRTSETVQKLAADSPPLITNIAFTQLTEGYVYDLKARRVIRRPDSAEEVAPPADRAAFREATLDGSALDDRKKGSVWIEDHESGSGLFRGSLTKRPGEGLLDGVIVGTRVWDSNHVEDRVGGVLWAMAKRPHSIGVFLDDDSRLAARPRAFLEVLSSTKKSSESALLLLDAHGMVSRAFSTYRSSPRSIGPRQSVAIEGARLHVLRSGTIYCAIERQVSDRGRPALVPEPDD